MKLIKLSIIVLGLCLTMGCVEKENLATSTKTETGKDWVKNESTQEYRGTDGKRIKEKYSVYEKIKCVDEKGHTLFVTTEEECLKKGGKVVDVFVSEEQTLRDK